MKEGVFKDLVVVELASALAGPAVGMFFAELGATVIKIENKDTGGDVTRRWKHKLEKEDDVFSAYYYCVNWGKETIMLNLKNTEDRQQVYNFIKKADVVIANFKSGSALGLGVDYEAIKKINPTIIYGNITAYGEDDSRPGFDAALQAETGWMSMNGDEQSQPTKVSLPIIDILAGHQLKEGVLVALVQRGQTGKGCKVTVSLYDASLSAMANQATTYLNLGHIPGRIGNQHPSIAPYGDIVTTSDKQDYLLAVGTEKHYQGLCAAIGRPDLQDDPRFESNHDRLINREDLMEELKNEISKMSAEKFEQTCDHHGVPLGPVRDLKQVFADEKAQCLILTEKLEDDRISKRVKTAVFNLEN